MTHTTVQLILMYFNIAAHMTDARSKEYHAGGKQPPQRSP